LPGSRVLFRVCAACRVSHGDVQAAGALADSSTAASQLAS
jgi:hypothetical protein